jgi:hypothetical protein
LYVFAIVISYFKSLSNKQHFLDYNEEKEQLKGSRKISAKQCEPLESKRRLAKVQPIALSDNLKNEVDAALGKVEAKLKELVVKYHDAFTGVTWMMVCTLVH